MGSPAAPSPGPSAGPSTGPPGAPGAPSTASSDDPSTAWPTARAEASRSRSAERWRPGASLDALRFVAALRAAVRDWMGAEGVLEVVTPVLSRAAPSDLHLDAFRASPPPGTPGAADGAPLDPHAGPHADPDTGSAADPNAAVRYLQTSPEYPMKRLLAAHGVDIWQIAPVFRAGERGARHNPEFTMLEWYRVGRDHVALMDDVEALLRTLWPLGGRPWLAPERRACRDLVEAALGGDGGGHRGAAPGDRAAADAFVDAATVRRRFRACGRSYPESIGDDADAAFDLLMDELVLPTLPTDRLTFVHGWPPSRAALARVGPDADGRAVAERFELYLGTLELGNGYHELAEATEQRQRFERELARRRALGRETPPVDEHLLAALAAGLPDCAGVAIGLERLAMAIGGLERIDDALAFGFERA